MLGDVDPGGVVRTPDRQVAAAVVRYAVLYPIVTTGGVYLVSQRMDVAFGTAGFATFVVAAVVTGIGASNTSPSRRALRSDGPYVDEASDSAAYWTESFVLGMVLFDLGLAAVLTAHAFWWAG